MPPYVANQLEILLAISSHRFSLRNTVFCFNCERLKAVLFKKKFKVGLIGPLKVRRRAFSFEAGKKGKMVCLNKAFHCSLAVSKVHKV